MLPIKTPVKLACLPCRTIKTRCDGRSPCANCYNNHRECQYRPSGRGGARRGIRAENAKKRANSARNAPPISLPSGSPETQACLVGLVYPLSSIQDVRELSSGNASLSEDYDHHPGGGTLTLRAYGCEGDLINAYDIFIHTYFPLLPAPAVPQYEDRSVEVPLQTAQADQALLPYWPTSPFALALSAVLVLIPPSGGSHSMSEAAVAARRSYAELYALAALDSIENWFDYREPPTPAVHLTSTTGAPSQWSKLHPNVPLKLEPILALVMLGMRARANQALTTAMDMSLHTASQDEPGGSDAQRRAWWMTVGSSCFSFTVLRSPTARVRSSLLTTFVSPYHTRNSAAVLNARIRLHRFRAFLDHPVFLGEHCGITSINHLVYWNSTHRLSPSRAARFNSTFAFTENESAAICLKSSLTVSRIFRNLRPPNRHYTDAASDNGATPMPSASRSPALILLLRKIRISLCSGDLVACYHLLSHPDPGSEVQDTERLVEELRHALESLIASMKADIVFEGVAGMAREIEAVYSTAFS
ncbi:hypothetical protein BDV29DRAFT_201453 [Aspergillus leporis]|uniref:Zn(2)-C6 fungal-type domain-containing protein n=1 Tax=Aspergillus leporis TaxID=41062 RepID=A0A5N5X468_9EURO|nr:hypothetical protein BDV29DRAFT_201453 [Aspergillus leporis]